MFSRFATRAARQAQRSFSTVAVATAARSRVYAGALAAAAVSSALVYTAVATPTLECAAKLPAHGVPGTNTERTFIAIKPDGVQRQLIGKIIQRFEEKGFTLVAMKMITPSKAMAEGHYDDLKNKPFFKSLTNFFSSGPVVAMVWQGKGAILTGRKLLGETDPAKSPAGSIRGDFSIDIGRNICHGSDGAEGAEHEINFWFKENEISDWQSVNGPWTYEKP